MSIKELQEHKAVTAMLFESLNQNIESVNISLEDKYNELKGQVGLGQTMVLNNDQKQASNGKSK